MPKVLGVRLVVVGSDISRMVQVRVLELWDRIEEAVAVGMDWAQDVGTEVVSLNCDLSCFHCS